ncbi:Ig-like domain repeat protein [Bernardetia sp. OM2101]|uniref:Ig-like domain repeat protein n=1 Tax=Bernardetia sp. OM2101 TaxID=3344876 RepID=UPI0035CF289D
MNFYLHKSFYKKYLIVSLFFLSLIIGFSRCVPIEDLLAPTISNLTINNQYNITDTIFLDAILTDNFGIDTVRIDIKKTDGISTLDTTILLNSDSIKARLLNLSQYKLVRIPVEAALGEYKLTLTVTDRKTKNGQAPNKTTTNRFFSVGKDVDAPSFPDVLLPDIIPFIDGNYVVCRDELVPLLGIARDNVGLQKITARFRFVDGSFSDRPIISNVSGDTVNLDGVFDTRLIFPNRPNNERFFLILTATDTENNTREIEIPFVINCDTEIPIIESIDTNIKGSITQNGDSINVIQGQELFITGGLITDRLGTLDRLIIYLEDRTEGEIVNDTLFSEVISGESYTISDNIPVFSFRSTPRIGKEFYSLKIKAIDAAGNESDIRDIKLFIAENLPPNFSELAFTLASNFDFQRTFSDDQNRPMVISAATNYRLINRLKDDLLLDSYEINWGIENQTPITTKTENNVNALDVSFSANQEDFTFSAEGNNAGTIYTLTIYAIDILDKESEITYYFQVR